MTKRVYGLDIMRCVAILTVVWGHVFHIPTHITDPFSRFATIQIIDGVSIFFTLSGFLIGGILLRKFSTEPLNVRTLFRFWRDRWLRTLPPYFFILVLLFVVTVKNNEPSRYVPFVVFLQNLWHNWVPTFGEAWSLSVEEWFYLLMPILLIIALRVRIPIPLLIGAVIIIGNLVRSYKIHLATPRDFIGFHFLVRSTILGRVDAIIYGVLGAYLSFKKHPLWTDYRKLFFYIGIVGFAANHLIYSFSSVNFFVLYLYLPLQGLFTLLWLPNLANIKEGKGRIARTITRIAVISYSIYLVHESVFIQLVRVWLPENFWIQLPFYFVWAFGAAFLLHHFVEKPVLVWRDRHKNPL